MLPTDRRIILKWCKYYYQVNPYIRSILHASVDLIKIDSTDGYIKALIKDILFDVLMYGEAFICHTNPIFTGCTLFDPGEINVYQNAFDSHEYYTFKMSSELRNDLCRLINRGVAIHPFLKNAILANTEEVNLDEQFISKIIYKTDPSMLRGTPPIGKIIKMLILKDEAKSVKKIIAMEEKSYIEEFLECVESAINAVIPQIKNFAENKLNTTVSIRNTCDFSISFFVHI